MTLAALDI